MPELHHLPPTADAYATASRSRGLAQALVRQGAVAPNANAWRNAFGVDEPDLVQRIGHRLWVQAEYGVLDLSHPVREFVQSRVHQLSALDDPPRSFHVDVLASRGMGINAWIYEDGNIVVTPELLENIEYVEELDAAILRHEMRHYINGHLLLTPEKSPLRFAGRERAQEYEADLDAFVDASHPDSGTNPLGALIFLERFAASLPPGEKHWDVAHGHPFDRLLNLSLVAVKWELCLDAQGLHRLAEMCPEMATTTFGEAANLDLLEAINETFGHAEKAWEHSFGQFLPSGSLAASQAVLGMGLNPETKLPSHRA